MENECISYNFRLFAIFVPKNYQIWWTFDVVITKIILLAFLRHGVVPTVAQKCRAIFFYLVCTN